MGTIYYDLAPIGADWVITSDDCATVWRFDSREKALGVASEAARNMWECSKLRTGVRIQQGDGAWHAVSVFGDDDLGQSAAIG